jgi:ABC-type multidrug transport system fused ATPase/permease subunit
MENESMNDKINITKYFYQYVKQNPLLFLADFLLLFVYPLHRVVLPKYYGKVITSLKGNININEKSNFVKNLFHLLIIYVIIQFMYTLNYKIQGYIIPKFSEFSIQKIFENILGNKNIDYENLETGEILAKIIKVPNVIYSFMDLLRSLLFSQFMVIGSVMFHYYTVSLNALLTFIFLVCGMMILQYISYQLTLNVELNREKRKDKVYQHFQDVLNNLISVVICKQEEHEKSQLHEIFKPYIEIFKKSMNLNFIMRIIFSLFNIFSFILLNYMIYKEYANKNISKELFVSSFIVTYSILGLFNEGYYSIRSIIGMYSQVNDMENFFNETPSMKRQDKTNMESKKTSKFNHGDIEVNNVSYVYKGNKNMDDKEYIYALNNVSVKIKKNENVAIVGQIGSGKSTLVKLLLKLNSPTSGNIKIGGIDISSFTREELLDHVFYVPQKPKLLNRTLYDNIIYGMENNGKSREENIKHVSEIMKNMGISDDVIQIFMKKMDTQLGVDGVKLSGGQRQIVWIIRAMLRDPSILIFDEPTSALDQNNKQIIIDTIKGVGKSKTVIIITHDQIDNEFRKIELKQGKLIQSQDFSSYFDEFDFMEVN